jgi:hypothetical protein
MQQQDEAAKAQSRQREQDLIAELSAKAEDRHLAARAQWEAESERKTLAAMDTLKTVLGRAEKERDDARQSAAESASHVQTLEKKLTEASSFLSGWRNGKKLAEVA